MHRELIIDQISGILRATEDSYEHKLVQMLDKASRIFVAGAGRSALVARSFAMRLMHGGYNVFVVGEIVTPSIRAGDLLLAISGSGETETLISHTKKARALGAGTVLISARDRSTIGSLADTLLRIGSPEQYRETVGMPMGTAFELSTLLFLEATVSYLIHAKGIPEDEMKTRHSNLE